MIIVFFALDLGSVCDVIVCIWYFSLFSTFFVSWFVICFYDFVFWLIVWFFVVGFLIVCLVFDFEDVGVDHPFMVGHVIVSGVGYNFCECVGV